MHKNGLLVTFAKLGYYFLNKIFAYAIEKFVSYFSFMLSDNHAKPEYP
jgi:hypothetical protein